MKAAPHSRFGLCLSVTLGDLGTISAAAEREDIVAFGRARAR